ncbi:MAG TPA: hypothetical protein VIW24_16530 [Aldersonia sp.]
MNWPTFFVLLLVGLVYLVVVWLTYSWMIASPRQWLLKSQIERLVTLIEVAERVDRAIDREVSWKVKESLADVQTELLTNRGNFFQRAFKAVHLNELMAVQQTVNGLSRHRAYLVPARDLASFAEPVFVKLAKIDKGTADKLQAGFDARDATTNGRRMLVFHADELCHAREDAELRSEFDRERASLWLALVGLWGIIAVGSVLGYLNVMLVGAVGGFLAPLIDARNPDSKQSTWGVRVLSPVAGALTAVAGLFVVNLLAQVDVLDQSFEQVTQQPPPQVALALALLFGFSGKMFSTMAITATSQIAGATPAPAPTTSAAQ